VKANYSTSITVNKEEREFMDLLRRKGVSIMSIFRCGLSEYRHMLSNEEPLRHYMPSQEVEWFHAVNAEGTIQSILEGRKAD
jgi:alkylated DNA nucleotide flippase Atl1